MGNSLFQQGAKPSLGMQAGKTYPAYLFPVSEAEVIEGQYGPSLKLRYAVVVRSSDDSRPPKIFELSELASETDALNGKLVKRMAAATGGSVTDQTDLSTLNEEGWVLVTLVKDRKDDRYLAIGDAMPFPDGMTPPAHTLAYDASGQMFMELAAPEKTVPARGRRRPSFAGHGEADPDGDAAAANAASFDFGALAPVTAEAPF